MSEKTGIKKISCKIKDQFILDEFSIFTGVWIHIRSGQIPSEARKLLKNQDFLNFVHEDLENFLSKNKFSLEEIERHFSVDIGILKNLKNQGKFGLTCEIHRKPKYYSKVIWFEDVRIQTNRSEVMLILNLDLQKLKPCYKTTISVVNFTEALLFFGIETDFQVFSMKRLRYLENKYKINLILCERCPETNEIKIVREIMRKKFDLTIHFIIENGASQLLLAPIENFEIIVGKTLFPKKFICDVQPKCKLTFTCKQNLEKHREKCLILSTKQIICKEKVYGDDKNIQKSMVEDGFAPEAFIDFRDFHLATFDCETIEEKTWLDIPENGLVSEADLRLLSIAVGSNIPGFKEKCWVRKSSDPEEARVILKKFVGTLLELRKMRQDHLPPYLTEMENKIIEREIELRDECKTQQIRTCPELTKIISYRNYITNLKNLSVFGYNSQRFDIPVIAGTLFRILQIATGDEVSVLKKGASYFSVSCGGLIFKDALNYTSPTRLEKFLQNWEAPFSKSIWPYSLFGSVEEIKTCKNFPKRSEFYSELKNEHVTKEEYAKAAREFHRRKLLPKNHPEKIYSMIDWLKIYNLLDVSPLATALENCFRSYSNFFNVDPIISSSLPGMAQMAMFKNLDPDSPLLYSIPEKYKEVNEIFRENVLGGLVNCYSRHATTDQESNYPERARKTKNGDDIKTIIFLDFNSMYLRCQDQPMPTGPGLLWRRKNESGNLWTKNVMTDGHSFKAQQWLSFMQHNDPFLKKSKGLTRIEGKFFRGEKVVFKSEKATWTVDGFARTDHGVKFYEFLGCHFHPGCPKCDPDRRDEFFFDTKVEYLRKFGVVEYIYECQWDEWLPQIKNRRTKSLPLILDNNHSEKDILNSICDGRLFGFILCDIKTPENLIEEYKNFPPIIKRLTITDEYLSPYMKGQWKKKNKTGEKLKRETVVQCFKAENHLLMTSLVKFYISIGLEITKIHRVIQYQPYKCLSPFVKHVTTMRLDAERNKKKTKANSAKTFGNSGYGKVSKYYFLSTLFLSFILF